MSLELLTNHENVHLSVRCRLVEILDVVHDTILSHLVASLCATTASRFLIYGWLSRSVANIL